MAQTGDRLRHDLVTAHYARILVALLLVGVGAAPAVAQIGRIVGQAVDEDGNPMEGVTITAESVSGDFRAAGFETTTGDDGRFSIIGLISGQWNFRAEVEGYTPVEGPWAITQGRNMPIAFTLIRIRHPLELALGESVLEGLDPAAVEAELAQADAAFNAQQFDQAVAGYDALLAKVPRFTALHVRIGDAHRHNRAYHAAIASYERALADAPNNADARAGLERAALEAEIDAADAAFNAQRWDDAIAGYRALLGRLSQAGLLRVRIGNALAEQGDHAGAIASYERVLEDDPNTDGARAGIARAKLAMGDFDAASQELEAAASGQDAAREDLYNLGELEFAKGELTAAAGWYEKAAMVDPNWGKPLYKLALVTLNRGDTETAKAYLQQVVDVDPESADAAQATATLGALP